MTTTQTNPDYTAIAAAVTARVAELLRQFQAEYDEALAQVAKHLGFSNWREALTGEETENSSLISYYKKEGRDELHNFVAKEVFALRTEHAAEEFEALIDFCRHALSLYADNMDEPVYALVNSVHTLIAQSREAGLSSGDALRTELAELAAALEVTI